MKKFQKGMAALLAISVISSMVMACSAELNLPEETNETTTEINVDYSSIRPQDDYYGYVNAEYLSGIDELFYRGDGSAFDVIDNNINDILETRILEIVTSDEEYEYGSKEQRIRDIYNQCLEYYNDDSISNQNKAQVMEAINEIMASEDIDSLVDTMFELQNELYVCKDIICLSVMNNDLDPNNYCIAASFVMSICGVSVEDIDEWNNNVSNIEDPASDYLTIAGVDADTADIYARELAGLALEITWASNVDLYDASSYYEYEEFVSNSELEEIFTNIDYQKIESLSGITNNPYGGWITYDKGQLSAVNSLFEEENLNALKTWLVYSVVSAYGDMLVDDYEILENYVVEDHSDFDRQALSFICNSGYLDDDISALYVEEVYTDEMEFKLRAMCEDIRGGYETAISNATWLSEETREGLITKLHNIVFLTGGNVDVDAVNVELSDAMGDNLWDTILGINAYHNEQNLSNIGEAFDRMVPGMPMSMVNACYMSNNTVTITVAIMGAPFFDVNADYYENLGGLGAVIAHEIGHAFDSNLIVFDSDGAYNPSWISAEDMASLEAHNQQAVTYFEETFAVFDVYYVDGEQTLGENYADLSGMEVVTSLCETREDLEKLLVNYATIWRTLNTTDGLVMQLQDDVHSPSYIRVNSILATLPVFYELYEVTEGDGMYVAPENRIGRWY